jgi:hypothetical protein
LSSPWIWQTRLSETPSTSPISRSVRFFDVEQDRHLAARAARARRNARPGSAALASLLAAAARNGLDSSSPDRLEDVDALDLGVVPVARRVRAEFERCRASAFSRRSRWRWRSSMARRCASESASSTSFGARRWWIGHGSRSASTLRIVAVESGAASAAPSRWRRSSSMHGAVDARPRELLERRALGGVVAVDRALMSASRPARDRGRRRRSSRGARGSCGRRCA